MLLANAVQVIFVYILLPKREILVISRLNYGNVLLYGIFSTLISRLPRFQHYAARWVTHSKERIYFAAVTPSSSEIQITIQDSTIHIQNN